MKGVAGLAIVSGAGILGVVAARSGTTETPVGAQEREVVAGTVECGRKPAVGVRVAVRGEGGELTGDTGADGVAQLEGSLGALGGGAGEVRVFVDEQPAPHVKWRKRKPAPAAPTRAPPSSQPAAPLPLPPPRPEGASRRVAPSFRDPPSARAGTARSLGL